MEAEHEQGPAVLAAGPVPQVGLVVAADVVFERLVEWRGDRDRENCSLGSFRPV